MSETKFNPNELILDRVRSVEEYDPATLELTGRYTQIEDPSLSITAESTQVTDAMGATIAEFYKASSASFSFTNSLFSLDLAASQFGSEKETADSTHKITKHTSEVIAISNSATVTLKHIPIGTAGAEVKWVKVINSDNTFGETYEVSATAGAGKFTIDAAEKLITLPAGTTGKVFVAYEYESENAAKVTKRTDGVPLVKTLVINVLFCEPCNPNIKYEGIIRAARAQINPESVDITLTSEGKHPAEYRIQKEYCDEDGALFDIIVSND